MKNKIVFGLFTCLLMMVATVPASAQLRTSYPPTVLQGNTADFGGTFFSGTLPVAKDTLQVSDTVAYVVSIQHQNDIGAYLTWYWQKSGSGTATITVSFLTGNDPYSLFPVQKGINDSAYVRTYTLSASGMQRIDFINDTAKITGRYLKIQYMTSATASVGGKVFTRLKTTIK